ncbi:MAG: tail fiber domain-containing protein [Opitutales bacterium]|nr:tail fiber domain-containing protein [Opitutales bacterium]
MQKTNLIKISCAVSLAAFFTASGLIAAVPPAIHYQGSVTVDGEPFDGTGLFQFALVDDGTENVRTAEASAVISNGFVTEIIIDDKGNGYTEAPAVEISVRGNIVAEAIAEVDGGEVVSVDVTYAGGGNLPSPPAVTIESPPPATMRTLWSHDGSSEGGAPPDTYVPLEVRDGIFSVLLGSGGTEPMDPGSLGDAPAFLRVWFDGGSGFEQLQPDFELSAVPYAMHASRAHTVSDGGLSADAFADNALADALRGEGIRIPATDSEPLEFSLGSEPVLRVEPATGNSEFRPNIFLGSPSNTADGPVYGATVSGGFGNSADGDRSVVGGGSDNTAGGFLAAVGGGGNNLASGDYATVAGGFLNQATDSYATVGGGDRNEATGRRATVAGGERNQATERESAVAGGRENIAEGVLSFVGGGRENTAAGTAATVPGGEDNTASGDYSLAAGRFATAAHDGAFVWADSSGPEFSSHLDDQFLIRAAGGVGINTNQPAGAFHVAGGNVMIGDMEGGRRLAVNTPNPLATVHAISSGESPADLLRLDVENQTAFRVFANRGVAVGGNWAEGDVPERGLRVAGSGMFQNQITLNTSTPHPTGLLHLRHLEGGRSHLILEASNRRTWMVGTDATTGWLTFAYASDVTEGSEGFESQSFISTNGSFNRWSDKRLKDGIEPLDGILDRVLALKPVSYRMARAPEERDFGFLAQEVEKVFPEAVAVHEEDGYLSLSYDTFSVLAVQAIREQQEIIDTQAAEIAELRGQLEELAEVAADNEELEARLARIEGWLETAELVSR